MLTSVHPALDHRIFYKECKSLVQAGFEVSIIAPHAKPQVVDGVRIVPLPPPTGRISRVTRTGWQLYRKALLENAAIYHFHDPELIGVGFLLRMHGKRVVYDIHEDVPRDLLHKFYMPKWIRRLLSWMASGLEALAARVLSGLVPVTPAIAARFKRRKTKTALVQNFPVLEEFPPMPELPWQERDQAVIFLGSMSRNRGVREMVEAMGRLPSSLEGTLRLLGPFSMPDLPLELAPLPGWKRVEYLGSTDREGVSRSLSRVRAGLVPIHPLPQLQVSYPIKMFEYMAAGIPVIASNFPLWRQVITDAGCGLLVDPLNPQEIADAIEYILTHPEEAEMMGRRGRDAIEKRYNWAYEARGLLTLYESLLAMPSVGT